MTLTRSVRADSLGWPKAALRADRLRRRFARGLVWGTRIEEEIFGRCLLALPIALQRPRLPAIISFFTADDPVSA